MGDHAEQTPLEAAARPGARLQRARESQGISQQKAAEDMHLDPWVIEALETDSFGKLGAPVYAKGYLKTYAAMLGVPADEIVAAYESGRERPSAAAPAPTARPAPQGTPIDLPWRGLAAAALFAALAVLVWWWKPWISSGVGRTHSAAAPDSAAQSGAIDAPVAAPAGTATPKPAPAAPVAVQTAPLQGVPVHLRLSFSADSRVEIRDANGRLVFAGIGSANSVKSLYVRAPLRVYLGFANGVQLEVNDRAVAIRDAFVKGDEARFQVGADGVLRRGPRS
jgi:cytoskeleton protein RodZ